ncbi:type VI secretion system contractile sheath domain-containing protein [Roseibium algae]
MDEDVDEAAMFLQADSAGEDDGPATLLSAEDNDASDEEDAEQAALLADGKDDSGSDEDDELADLMAGNDDDKTEDDTELAALLADDDVEDSTGDDAELAALLADDDSAPELEALLAEDHDDPAADDATDTADAPAIRSPFGTLSADRPEDRDEARAKFRIAILADFSGRASRGEMEIGDSLANRKAIRFDVDNIDDVIARFGTTLVLPLGNDGEGIEVKLSSLDDLHPDELYENVELFEELSSFRQRVARGDSAALAELQTWGEQNGNAPRAPSKRAKGSSVPADRKLSDFQALIGDMQGHQAQACPASDIIGRIVAPFVQASPDPAQETMLAAVDEALSSAMRTILHHPDFQSVESTWRSLELLARRIETGAALEIVLYDVSAEEWAADLAAQDDLAESGLFRMLAEEPRLDEAQGPLSSVFGLYTLEETPPHAELLARMSKISAWMNAPFVTAISPLFLDTRKEFRHPLVAETWNNLRALPEAAYVGLAAPRFLLRLPYGAKTEPVDPFDFEEFTLRSGLTGMLWANPVILSAILMAATVSKSGKKMQLGEVMSLGDIPVHTMVDPYGDQVALPCTERLLNTRTTAEVVTRGFIPVLSIKGRNEVRQGSFQALGAGELAGPWSPSSAMASPASEPDTSPSESASEPSAEIEAPTSDSSDDPGLDLDVSNDADAEDDIDLDDLLAGFGDDADASEDEEMDPELAALLEGL